MRICRTVIILIDILSSSSSSSNARDKNLSFPPNLNLMCFQFHQFMFPTSRHALYSLKWVLFLITILKRGSSISSSRNSTVWRNTDSNKIVCRTSKKQFFSRDSIQSNCVHSFHFIDHDLLTEWRFILLTTTASTTTKNLLNLMCDCKQCPCIIFDDGRKKKVKCRHKREKSALSNQTTKKN